MRQASNCKEKCKSSSLCVTSRCPCRHSGVYCSVLCHEHQAGAIQKCCCENFEGAVKRSRKRGAQLQTKDSEEGVDAALPTPSQPEHAPVPIPALPSASLLLSPEVPISPASAAPTPASLDPVSSPDVATSAATITRGTTPAAALLGAFLPTMTQGNKINWDSDEKNMIESNDELVRVARYVSPPWRKEEGVTSIDEMYQVGKQRERWATVASNFHYFSITGDKAKARIEVLMKRVNQLKPVPRSRNSQGGSGSDDMQRLNERERSLLVLLEEKCAYEEWVSAKQGHKEDKKEKKNQLSQLMSQAAVGMAQQKRKRRRKSSFGGSGSESSDSDLDTQSLARVLTASEKKLQPLQRAFQESRKDQEDASSEHKKQMGDLVGLLRRDEEKDRAESKKAEDREREDREQARLDREEQRTFMRLLLAQHQPPTPSQAPQSKVHEL